MVIFRDLRGRRRDILEPMRSLLLAALLSSCTYQAREHVINAGLGTTTVVITCDVAETMWLGDNGAWDRTSEHADGTRYELLESNPLLGRRPSPRKLALAWSAAVMINASVHVSRLPQWARLAWSAAILGVELYAVGNNARWSPVCGL